MIEMDRFKYYYKKRSDDVIVIRVFATSYNVFTRYCFFFLWRQKVARGILIREDAAKERLQGDGYCCRPRDEEARRGVGDGEWGTAVCVFLRVRDGDGREGRKERCLVIREREGGKVDRYEGRKECE